MINHNRLIYEHYKYFYKPPYLPYDKKYIKNYINFIKSANALRKNQDN